MFLSECGGYIQSHYTQRDGKGTALSCAVFVVAVWIHHISWQLINTIKHFDFDSLRCCSVALFSFSLLYADCGIFLAVVDANPNVSVDSLCTDRYAVSTRSCGADSSVCDHMRVRDGG